MDGLSGAAGNGLVGVPCRHGARSAPLGGELVSALPAFKLRFVEVRFTDSSHLLVCGVSFHRCLSQSILLVYVRKHLVGLEKGRCRPRKFK